MIRRGCAELHQWRQRAVFLRFPKIKYRNVFLIRLAEAALEEEEGEEEEGDCEDDEEEEGGEGETRRPSFKTNASNNASGVKGDGWSLS